ncbi:uncharacterized protein LOC111248035 isoform X2 [Varroa destructor]|uniref:Uncharacterized protein n=1 Tax=Varroa destructor TaxID=109461 RepID=A0A7M7M7J0_VARDE|nr:uncharacterized protein LOC111248035 isoform X2 [Varroa destructor]
MRQRCVSNEVSLLLATIPTWADRACCRGHRCCSDPEGYETQRIVFVLYEEIIYLNVSGNSFIQTNHIYQPQIKEQTPTIDQTTVSLISTDSALYPYYIESLQRNAKTDSHSK